jgi:hypothetical protein
MPGNKIFPIYLVFAAPAVTAPLDGVDIIP